jgi:hypothetical protein
MSAPEYFETLDDISVFRPIGHVSLDQAVQIVSAAIAYARDQNIRKLLVVTSALSGFEPPGIFARFSLVEEWVRASRGVVRVALVARPEMIDFQKFGVTVANNRGLISDVFSSEDEAKAWLQSLK